MKVMQIIITGLGTTPANPSADPAFDDTRDCGMLKTAEAIRDQHPEHQHRIVSISWDGNGSPDANARDVIAAILDFNPDFIFTHHHSFGNQFFVFLINWIAFWHSALGVLINFAFGYDPCKNPLFGNTGWSINGNVVKDWRAWFQKNGKPAFVCGDGFFDPEGWHNIDVTSWGDGHVTQDDYVGVPDDERIRAQVYTYVNAALAAAQSSEVSQ